MFKQLTELAETKSSVPQSSVLPPQHTKGRILPSQRVTTHLCLWPCALKMKCTKAAGPAPVLPSWEPSPGRKGRRLLWHGR